jgi:thiamine-phosphate pyrophosphorylase
MRTRQPLPRIWLVTDERQPDLIAAVGRLPPGAGILFRHHGLQEAERRALFSRVRAAAGPEELVLLLAGSPAVAREWGADGWHGWEAGEGLRSAPVHNLDEVRRAEAQGASLLFLSPVFPTRSHPGVRGMGTRRFARLARLARRPVIALGGVTQASGAKLMRLGAHGWAGIDAWNA